MNSAQRRVLIVLLAGVGAALACIFLRWGEGAFNSMGGDRITIFVLDAEKSSDSIFGHGYGLYTTHGIPGVLLGLVAPLCLFAGAAYMAFANSARK
jgi:hypothetical protein